jgi:low temperature requirement protein LtrA
MREDDRSQRSRILGRRARCRNPSMGTLRAREGGEQQVTPLELFFDLVYVFAITQLSHLLLKRPTLGGAKHRP